MRSTLVTRPSGDLERVTFRAPERHLEALDELVDAGDYPNRSEALRDGLEHVLEAEADDD